MVCKPLNCKQLHDKIQNETEENGWLVHLYQGCLIITEPGESTAMSNQLHVYTDYVS